MKTDVYGTHALWMHIQYLIKVSPPVCEINGTYPYFKEDTTERTEVLHLPRFMCARKRQKQYLNPGMSIRNLNSISLRPCCPSTVPLWLKVVASCSLAPFTTNLWRISERKPQFLGIFCSLEPLWAWEGEGSYGIHGP